MYCVECGATLPDDAKFCSKCGKKQEDNIKKDIEIDTSKFYTIKNQSIYFKDNIDQRKLGSFIECLTEIQKQVVANAKVLCYFDETITGVGDRGVAVTSDNIFYRVSMLDNPEMINISDISSVKVSGILNREIKIEGKCGARKLLLTQGNTGAEMLANFIKYLKEGS